MMVTHAHKQNGYLLNVSKIDSFEMKTTHVAKQQVALIFGYYLVTIPDQHHGLLNKLHETPSYGPVSIKDA